MMAIAVVAALVVNLLLGLPPFLCLLFAVLVGFLFIDPALFANTLPQRFFGGTDILSLMAIPLFALADNLMNHSSMTPCLMYLANVLVGHFRGGLDHINMVAGVFFAGVNRSVAAGTSALNILLMPAMEKKGYLRRFAAGLTADGSLISPITPPNISMISHSSLTSTSAGELFLARVIPGLLLAAALTLLNVVHVYRNGLQARHAAPAWGKILTALSGTLTTLIVPAIIVAGTVLGLVTPTKLGALIALYVVPVGLFQRQPGLVELRNSLRETVCLTASVYVITAVASVVNWLLNYAQVASELAQLLEPFGYSPTLMLFIINVVIFVRGMFMEEVSALMLLTPITAPVALAAGMDPVHLGLILTPDITIALITPPMGIYLFIVATIGCLDILEMFKGIWPFILLTLEILSLLILFPSLTLWLPRLFN